MTQGRPFEFPDPNDRSVNNPHVIVERNAILGLYNQANPSNQASNVSESVRKWFEQEAMARGWAKVMFPNQNTAVLEANVAVS
ncbi:hypothetical protein [Ectothiorhodospira sp. BSL-9]|uniref:hypothetical protein n=1 Tax=Ectothiorhodospira sp. BSL-9 TaxID=1442136 RepID=UPI0012E7F49D|nr:hypothetical protein [Ectothiorhodospira sp. BSL-9]